MLFFQLASSDEDEDEDFLWMIDPPFRPTAAHVNGNGLYRYRNEQNTFFYRSFIRLNPKEEEFEVMLVVSPMESRDRLEVPITLSHLIWQNENEMPKKFFQNKSLMQITKLNLSNQLSQFCELCFQERFAFLSFTSQNVENKFMYLESFNPIQLSGDYQMKETFSDRLQVLFQLARSISVVHRLTDPSAEEEERNVYFVHGSISLEAFGQSTRSESPRIVLGNLFNITRVSTPYSNIYCKDEDYPLWASREYFTICRETDVFAFGIVALEILFGRRIPWEEVYFELKKLDFKELTPFADIIAAMKKLVNSIFAPPEKRMNIHGIAAVLKQLIRISTQKKRDCLHFMSFGESEYLAFASNVDFDYCFDPNESLVMYARSWIQFDSPDFLPSELEFQTIYFDAL